MAISPMSRREGACNACTSDTSGIPASWQADRMARRLNPAVEDALLVESAKKSDLLWVEFPVLRRPRAVWHVWADDRAYVVGGGLEQPLPGLSDGGVVEVTARSKDNGGRLVTWSARCRRVPTASPEWDAVVPLLHAKRLNPPDGEDQPARWAASSEVWALEPIGIVDAYGRGSEDAHLAPPPPTNATTSGPLPMVLHRRQRRRPSLTD